VNAGDTAPRFSVVTEDGKTITPSNFGGKLLVLNFWASWCAPCVAETPTLNQFQRTFAGKGVVVLGVSMDRNEKQYKDFLARYRISFETSRDPEGDISASYGTFQFPDSYIIDPSGKYLYVANQGSSSSAAGNLGAYSIGPDGGLTILTLSPFTTVKQPTSLAADPNGKYLMVGGQAGSLEVFLLDPGNGTLGEVATYTPGGYPSSIAILQ